MATSPSPEGAAQIGVGFGLPSLVKVVNRMYSLLATSAKVAGTLTTVLVSPRGRPRCPAAPVAARPSWLSRAGPTCHALLPPATALPSRAAPTGWTRP